MYNLLCTKDESTNKFHQRLHAGNNTSFYFHLRFSLVWKITIQCTLAIEDLSSAPASTSVGPNSLFINYHCIYYIITCSNIWNLQKIR